MASEEQAPATVSITTAPAKGQLVEHERKTYTTVKEGKAYILVPPNARTSVDPQQRSKKAAQANDSTQVQNVFYNPIQQFNRDLSVLAICTFGGDACERKRAKHDVQHERNERKKERKRKREDEEENVEQQGGVKVRKGGAIESAITESVNGAENASGDFEKQGGEQDGGVSVIEEGSTNEIGVSGETQGGNSAQTNGIKGEKSVQNDISAEFQPQWRPRFRILDALSATGLRALRYASEIPFATAVVANDREKNAVKSIDLNVQHSNLSSCISTTTGDALGHMYSTAYPSPHSHGPHHISGKYDVIDLDPYGTAAPFIDAALQALEDGGLLCVTCTDSGVFASCGYSEKTFALYGGMPVKGPHSHEGGLRLILHSIATAAAKHGISIEPLLSLSIDFYVRLFVRVRRSPAEVKFLAGKTMLVYGCDHGCGAWKTQFLGRHMKHKNAASSDERNSNTQVNWKFSIAQAPSSNQLCEHCGSKMHAAGPMWGGPIHNAAFVARLLNEVKDVDGRIYETKGRLEGMLDTALDELSVNIDPQDVRPTSTPIDDDGIPVPNPTSGTPAPITQTPPEAIDHHPFFFIPSTLCKILHCQAPSEPAIKGALRHLGYRVTRSHCKAGSLKTDAPWTVIWEVMREWVRQKSPIKEGAVKEGTPGWEILRKTWKPDEVEDGADGVEDAVNRDDRASSVGNGMNGIAHEETANANSMKRSQVVFDEKLGKDKAGQRRLVRYQQNPRENWGPMTKAKGTG